MPSPSSRKLVVRFNFWSDPAMEERFAREPDIAQVSFPPEVRKLGCKSTCRTGFTSVAFWP